ncbi:MAG: amino acid ABC transporter substrate-binding protein [Proteobacteria bacterium]|nr:MAG: amino acid ABC transporter substrate-binding protein [Pseudomonadota bacterium]
MSKTICASIFKLTVFVVVVASLAVGLITGWASAQQSTLERIRATGVMRVGLEGTYPPFNFVDENNQMAGFDVDISNEIARRLGVRAEFVGTLWSSLIAGLQTDKFDVIIAQMTITEERKQSVDFTNPYVITGAVLVSRANDNRFSKLSDIAGHRVGVGIGTTFEEVARSVPGADVRTYDSFQEYAQELLTGRLDVIINDQLSVAYAIKQHGLPLKITSDIVNEDVIGIAVKKGNEDFVEMLNHILADMVADGTYQQIFQKWFDAEPALLKYMK